MTRGDVRVRGVNPKHLGLVLDKLRVAGADVTAEADGFRVVQEARPTAVNFATLPYPGFPTDLQPMAIGLAAVAEGTSMITENVFEARFRFVEEMIRLGADARTDGHHAVIRESRSCRVRRCGPRTSGQAPAWCWRGSSPTGLLKCTTSSTSTGATPIRRDPPGTRWPDRKGGRRSRL